MCAGYRLRRYALRGGLSPAAIRPTAASLCAGTYAGGFFACYIPEIIGYMIVVESVAMDYEWSGEDDMSESVEQYWDAVKT